MSNIRILVCTLALAATLGACSKTETPAASSAAPAAVETSAAATPAATDSAAAPSSAAVTGIADCDQFLNAYEQCLTDKVPAQARDQMLMGVAQWKKSWAEMAANDAMKASLPAICAQSREASRPALQAYGCSL